MRDGVLEHGARLRQLPQRQERVATVAGGGGDDALIPDQR
jgi:hypothetical protein